MIEVVINYDKSSQCFKIYEPTTDTLLVSTNLSEALVNLSSFLSDKKMIQGNILNYPDISYHIDSHTMQAMVESNVNLLKRLNNSPTGFMMSSQRFGTTLNQQMNKNKSQSGFDESTSKKFGKRRSGSFSGKSAFKASNKKFGGNY